ncbi:MAG: hypothetical protein JXA10_17145 [Anaerolineae bacterium]|nr:hypothetical protein [Anaerolineae bacterium]
MSFSIEQLPDEPIVLVTLGADYEAEIDTPEIARQFGPLVESVGAPVKLVIDVRPAFQRATMNNITNGMVLAVESDPPLLRHPLMDELIFVAVTDVMKHVADGFRSPQFGAINVKLFQMYDQALAYARGIES